MNLKNLKKALEDKRGEKTKIYGFIGMEVYDLFQERGIDLPEIKRYIDLMNVINVEIEELEKSIKEQEKVSLGKNVCACGYKLSAKDRFCPNCGEVVQRDCVICTCGNEIKRNARFCGICGKPVEEIMVSNEEKETASLVECICGARVPAGQFMCLECGRKIED